MGGRGGRPLAPLQDDGPAALGCEAAVHAVLCRGGLFLSRAPVLDSQTLCLPEQLLALPCGRAPLLQHELLRFLWPLRSEGSPGAVGKTCVTD